MRQEVEARSAEFLADDEVLPSQDGEGQPQAVASISALRKLLAEARA
ncbi:hypothetical protein ACWEQ2_09215 [Streptomyces sp. NPDC004096]